MTKAERQYQEAVRDFGCVVCHIWENVYSPAEIHHMLSGGRRMGEMYVLPLCMLHHRGGRDDLECVSRDHNQRRFELRYGSESGMREWLNAVLAEKRPSLNETLRRLAA